MTSRHRATTGSRAACTSSPSIRWCRDTGPRGLSAIGSMFRIRCSSIARRSRPPTRRLAALEAKLSYTDVRKSLGYVDDERGQRWFAAISGEYVDGITVPKVYGTYDYGIALPLGHSSIWSRSAAGFSPRDRELPFANFYFGGFGNNWVDRADEKRYREWYSFPGARLNEIGGRNFIKSGVEWNAPPWRFRRLRVSGFYPTLARPAWVVTCLPAHLHGP